MKQTDRKNRALRAAGAALAAALAGLFLWMNEAKAPVDAPDAPIAATDAPAHLPAEAGKDRVAPGCEITQTMLFSRCGHSVTRRIAAPEGTLGGDFGAIQAYYDLWQVETFAPDRIVMSREIALYCPMHRVLTVNEAGDVVLTENVYGDGMAVKRTYPYTLEDFDEETREKLRLGLGFDGEEEAAAWLAAH